MQSTSPAASVSTNAMAGGATSHHHAALPAVSPKPLSATASASQLISTTT
jgi:hypothetical protein